MSTSVLAGPGPAIIGFVSGSLLGNITDIILPHVAPPSSLFLAIILTVVSSLLLLCCRARYSPSKYADEENVPYEVLVYMALGFSLGVWFCSIWTMIGRQSKLA